MLGYSTREVSRLLDLSEGRIRSYVNAGFLAPRRGPGGAFRFTFRDLVVLRAAKGLLDAGASSHRVRAALEGLRERLPRGRSLAAVRLTHEDGRVVVHEEGEAWLPESGQRLLDFEVAELAAEAAPLAERAAEAARRRAEELDAEAWYELAYELEATSPEEAREAYRRALALAPEHADALVNLGRLLHEAGRTAEAEALYRKAAAARPDDPTPHFNLGVALQDLGRLDEAIEAYSRSLACDPAYVDAHYNLAGLYERRGDAAAALRSLKAYRALAKGRR